MIATAQPSPKITSSRITHGDDSNANKTNVGTRGTAFEGVGGVAAHNEPSNGVVAVVEEVLKTFLMLELKFVKQLVKQLANENSFDGEVQTRT